MTDQLEETAAGDGLGGHRRPRPGRRLLAIAVAVAVAGSAGAAVAARTAWQAAAGQRATLLAAPENGSASNPVWQTCIALAAHLDGPYRVYNDAWASRECIRSTGPNLRVLTRAHPAGGDVVAYPNIQYGAAYGYTTPGSGLPVRLSRMGHPVFTATASGRSGGHWIADFDSWFFPSRDTSQHGTVEMIIVLRYMPGMARGRLVRIGGVRWWLREAETCNSGLCWPLIRYFAARQTWQVRRLPMRAFIRIAEHRRMLPARYWWGSTAFGYEMWSGGRGLTARLIVQRYPHRR